MTELTWQGKYDKNGRKTAPVRDHKNSNRRCNMLSAQNFVEARLYQNEEALIQDALRHLLRARPGLKIQLAVYQYKEKKVSLAKAADLAGISWAQMKDILMEQNIPLRLGPETVSEAMEEIQSLREELESQA